MAERLKQPYYIRAREQDTLSLYYQALYLQQLLHIAVIVPYITLSHVQRELLVQSLGFTMFMWSIVIITILRTCHCYTGYDLFSGFDSKDDDVNTTVLPATLPRNLTTPVFIVTNTTSESESNFKCPEEERPVSIGPYEIPTQRDLALMTKGILNNLFDTYYQEVLLLIKDIKEATKASVVIEEKCPKANRAIYKDCVKSVKGKSERTMRNLIAALHNQKIDVAALTDDKVCDLSTMKTDPVELVKILSQDNASLQFALPGFLRLLSSCSYYCSKAYYKGRLRKAKDLELVVKHFLSQKF